MRKKLAFLFALFFAVQFTSAQNHIMYVLGNDGCLSIYTTSKVFFDDSICTVNFTHGDMTARSKDSYSSSFTMNWKSEEAVALGTTPERGVCYSSTRSVPTVEDSCQALGPGFSGCSFTLSSLSAGTTYYYCAYAKLGDAVYYSEVAQFRTLSAESGDQTVSGHKFIDLGLPSGKLWAETNIGAETATDYGNYYAWGETATKTNYSFTGDYYKYGTLSNVTKYNTSDKKTELENADDAAYKNWGSYCTMPTEEDFNELLNNCDWTWGSRENASGTTVYGYTVTSKQYGNSIFLPAAGYYNSTTLNKAGETSYYWSKKLGSDVRTARRISLTQSAYNMGYSFRSYGCPVRAVKNP